MASQGTAEAARGFISAYTWETLGSELAPDCRYEEHGTGRRAEGRDQIVELFQGWAQAMPDSNATVTSAVAADDTVALEVTWEGTLTGCSATSSQPGSAKSARSTDDAAKTR
jgi:hypothetical protein